MGSIYGSCPSLSYAQYRATKPKFGMALVHRWPAENGVFTVQEIQRLLENVSDERTALLALFFLLKGDD